MLITSSTTINAPVEEVKKVFFDFPGHASWNPFFKSIEVLDNSEPTVGSRLRVVMQTENSSSPQTFKPYVLENSANVFSWRGTLLFEFIATGHHKFEFTPETKDGKEITKLTQSENFGGFLWSLMGNILTETEKSFNLMNAALKKEVEGKAH